MPSAKVTSKGQITIPAEIREELKLKSGDRILFYKGQNGRFSFYAKNGSVEDLKGILGAFPHPVSIEEMNEAIARGAAGLPEPEDEAVTA
jgi:antitoxin PrlF